MDRRNALVELDALVALMLGVDGDDQLCTVYRTQFAVLYGYDHWDVHLRRERASRAELGPDRLAEEGRQDHRGGADCHAPREAGSTYTYELPFGTLDREADMRTAYAEFERRLAAKTGGGTA